MSRLWGDATTGGGSWLAQNQRYLMARVASVRADIRRLAAATAVTQPGDEGTSVSRGGTGEDIAEAAAALSAPAALDILVERLALSPFERDLLLLCCGVELDTGFATDCALAAGGARAPSFALALAALKGAHWNALMPVAPLRRFGLIELGSGATLVQCSLRLSEKVLHFLTGLSYSEPTLAAVLSKVAPPALLPPSLGAVAGRLADLLTEPRSSWQGAPRRVLTLYGEDPAAQLAVAATAASALGLSLLQLDATDLPSSISEQEAFTTMCVRECILEGAVLAVVRKPGLSSDQNSAAERFARAYGEPLFIIDPAAGPGLGLGSTGESPALGPRLQVCEPTRAEKQELLRAALGEHAAPCAAAIERTIGHFELGLGALQSLGQSVCDTLALQPAADPGALLWECAQKQARTYWAGLAQRIESTARWDDLVLPPQSLQNLTAIAGQLRHRDQVYNAWSMGRPGQRGLGISALFVGKSGTGKTLAAEVLASELQLDLYRIDLSQIIDKYIGETEKNLRRIFAAAERSGGILLFDEADALFGRRSQVKDSHDRYANIEVSYLLSAMESYRGLAILTTNLGDSIDEAFLRRLRFVIEFPFPDQSARHDLWRRTIHPGVLSQGIDFAKLARLTVAGGGIRNIALNAAFLAAAAGEPLRMPHLLRATRSEFAKLRKPLNESELAGWD